MSAEPQQGRRQSAASTDNRKDRTMARSKRAAAAGATEAPDDGLTPVRTTFNPHEVIRVGDAELLDLERQGLVYKGEDLAEPDATEGEQLPSGVVTDPPPAAADETDENDGSDD